MICQIRRVHDDGRRELLPCTRPLGAAIALAQASPDGVYEILDPTGRVLDTVVSLPGSVVVGGVTMVAKPSE